MKLNVKNKKEEWELKNTETLADKWNEMECEANDAIALYDMGYRDDQRVILQKIWNTFKREFEVYEKRQVIGDSYQQTMDMMLNRLYLDIDDRGNQQELWDFCWEVCRIFSPNELWLEDYVGCIGMLMEKKGWHTDCDEWFSRYHALEPEQPVYMARWAMCLFHRGNAEKAGSLLDEILDQDPDCDAVYLNFYFIAWKLYEMMGEASKAQICKQKIIDLDEYMLEDADVIFSDGHLL
ncbi:MAG: hypothetical protein HFE64_04835 [Lachnospiraceae bacterium]|jgi:tetratricopeptide (TPR) repeat protein|nr:hypothetical protein [Lachnospiraceae bacterium]